MLHFDMGYLASLDDAGSYADVFLSTPQVLGAARFWVFARDF